METCCIVLTFDSVDEILWCNYSNERRHESSLQNDIWDFSLIFDF